MPEGYNEVSKCVSISSSFPEGRQGASHDGVCLCVRPKGVSPRPVGKEIGQPVCDFAAGRDKERKKGLCLRVYVFS